MKILWWEIKEEKNTGGESVDQNYVRGVHKYELKDPVTFCLKLPDPELIVCRCLPVVLMWRSQWVVGKRVMFNHPDGAFKVN